MNSSDPGTGTRPLAARAAAGAQPADQPLGPASGPASCPAPGPAPGSADPAADLPFARLSGLLRRARAGRWMWSVLWFAALFGALRQTWGPGHSTAWSLAVTAGAAVFAAACLAVFAATAHHRPLRERVACVGVMAAVCLLYNTLLGSSWSGMFFYAAVACALALPIRPALWTNGGLIAAGLLTYLIRGAPVSEYWAIMLAVALTGVFSVYGAERRRVEERLRRGERAMAQLAVNEERVRFARDLHDLLGHSLSLLALKSQLAGRLLETDPEACARQIAEMEEISRQALAEVRESVTGYRRPTLAVELARAHGALATAGIESEVDPALAERARGLAPGREAALAWALREAVTNVVRHASGARVCRVRLVRRGGEFTLTVADDAPAGRAHGRGRGGRPAPIRAALPGAFSGLHAGAVRRPGDPDAAGPEAPGTDTDGNLPDPAPTAEPVDFRPGNGLNGLAERLALEGGRLEAGPTSTGFQLRAHVPAAAPVEDDSSGAQPPAAVRAH